MPSCCSQVSQLMALNIIFMEMTPKFIFLSPALSPDFRLADPAAFLNLWVGNLCLSNTCLILSCSKWLSNLPSKSFELILSPYSSFFPSYLLAPCHVLHSLFFHCFYILLVFTIVCLCPLEYKFHKGRFPPHFEQYWILFEYTNMAKHIAPSINIC